MKQPPKGRRLAGIIPLCGRENRLQLPWPDYLQPIGENYTSIERSVLECAFAGCDSIWVVCNDDFAPLARERCGDYVLDPQIFDSWEFIKRKEDYKKYIPIFYVPIRQRDRKRRDSLGWSIIQGALTAFQVSSKISSWVVPSKYYVSFPFGLYDPKISQSIRSIIRGPDSVYFSHDGQTVRDNKYLAFTFFPEDWLKFKRNVKQNCSGANPLLPAEERWSSRHFSLDKIFNCDTIDIGCETKIEEYYDLDSWPNLLKFYKSDMYLVKSSNLIIGPYNFSL